MQINGIDDLFSIIAQFLANRATQNASTVYPWERGSARCATLFPAFLADKS
jgi:hypothetical protein